jgi:hypothetical protein
VFSLHYKSVPASLNTKTAENFIRQYEDHVLVKRTEGVASATLLVNGWVQEGGGGG